MKLISIIMPYFQKRNYVKKSIKSVLNQTYKKFELIVVYDDESKQDLKFLKKITYTDPRIRLLINKKNVGAGISRNYGINKSKGEYIAFIDADDIWHKSKLKKQLNFMLENNYNFSHTDYSIVDKYKKNNFIRKAKVLNYDSLLKSCDIGLSTVMLNKKLIKRNKILFPNLKTKEDFVFWLKITNIYKCKIYPLNQNLTSWNKTNNSLSSDTFQKIFDGFRVYYIYCKFNFIKSIYFTLILSFNFLNKNL